MNNKLKKSLPILLFDVALIILILIVFKMFLINSLSSETQYLELSNQEDYSHTHFEEISRINLATKDMLVKKEEEPTILFASDYQGDSRYNNAYKILLKAKQHIQPNLFVVCGDYQIEDQSNFENTEQGIVELSDIFSHCFNTEIPQIYIQGNHDSLKANGLSKEGIYESDKYIIYVINRNSFPNCQMNQTYQENIVKNTAEKLKKDLQELVDKGNKKPIFIATHVPLHYTDRMDGQDNTYAKYLVEVLNEFGKELDIVYLFGHNHSGTYDDYIGGSINYIAKGDEIKIGGINEQAIINFTYLNAGYIGYSNNSVTEISTRETTATAIKVTKDSLIIQKYSQYGEYYTNPIIVKLYNK